MGQRSRRSTHPKARICAKNKIFNRCRIKNHQRVPPEQIRPSDSEYYLGDGGGPVEAKTAVGGEEEEEDSPIGWKMPGAYFWYYLMLRCGNWQLNKYQIMSGIATSSHPVSYPVEAAWVPKDSPVESKGRPW